MHIRNENVTSLITGSLKNTKERRFWSVAILCARFFFTSLFRWLYHYIPSAPCQYGSFIPIRLFWPNNLAWIMKNETYDRPIKIWTKGGGRQISLSNQSHVTSWPIWFCHPRNLPMAFFTHSFNVLRVVIYLSPVFSLVSIIRNDTGLFFCDSFR